MAKHSGGSAQQNRKAIAEYKAGKRKASGKLEKWGRKKKKKK